MNPRTLIRRAIRECLEDEEAGFNVRLAEQAPLHNAEAFEIDFRTTGESRNFYQGYFTPDEEGYLVVFREVPAMALYTVGAINQNRVKFRRFSGQITARCDVYLRFRQRDENLVVIDDDEPDAIADACEQALLLCLEKLSNRLPGEISWNGDMEFNRSPIIYFGDGFAQLIQTQMVFPVNQ